MSQPTDPINEPKPIADSMPPIPTFEPAPVPKPVVTDTMPPIPVTAVTPAPAPVKTASMPAFNAPASATPAPVTPTTPNMPAFVSNPAPVVPKPAPAPAPVPVAPKPVPAPAPAPAVPINPAAASAPKPVNPFMQSQPAPNFAPSSNLNYGQSTDDHPINPAMSAALEEALRADAPAVPKAPNAPVMPNAAPAASNAPITPNAPAMPNAMPNAAPAPMPAPNPQPVFNNPFAEAMEKNKEIRSVSFSSQDSKPLVSDAAKSKKKLFIIAGIAVVVVLILALVIAMLMAGGNKGSSSPTPTPTPTPAPVSNKAGKYVCTKTYLESEFEPFGDAKAATETFDFEFSEDGFENIRSVKLITYDDADAVKAAFGAISSEYTNDYEALGLVDDPLSSTYKRSGDTLRITRKATALNANNLTLFGFEGETLPASFTSDDLQDLLEANSFSCDLAVEEAEDAE